MIREIKFRAWDKIKNIILPVEAIDWWHGRGWTCLLRPAEPKPSKYTKDGLEYEPIENLILLQYIDLKDKNGKEIYEHDIVKTEEGIIGTVEWDQKYCGFFIKNKRFTLELAYQCEVIGNIFENPELLK